MTKLVWDSSGARLYETGVDRGVLYIPNVSGVYTNGVAWNGLTTVTESPSGAEATPLYADNIKYLNLISAEQFGATIEAFTFPEEFAQFDGILAPQPGVYIGQQSRKAFGLSYRTRVGNDLVGDSFAYKVHLIYNATAAPSEKAYGTINDSPEAITFSWELTTTPVDAGVGQPTAQLTLDSSKVDPTGLATLETALYGAAGVAPRLPTPVEVLAMFSGTITSATPAVPTFVSTTGIITIPTTTGVNYTRDDTGAVVTGTVTVLPATPGAALVIKATPKAGYSFPANVDNDWQYTRT